MKTLKFIGGNIEQKKFILELRKRVNSYFQANNISTKGNWKMYLKAIVMLSLYLAPFIVIVTVDLNAWVALLFALLMGIGEAGIGMSVMHDAAHGAFSEKKWVNDLFAAAMYLLGSNTANWKLQHNYYHHMFTNIYGYDTDIETKAVIRLCENAPLKKIHRYQHIYAFPFYGLMTLSKLVTDFGQLIEMNKSGITKERHFKPRLEFVKLIIAKIIYLTIIIGLPLLLTDFKWWQVLIGFAVLHIVAGSIMGTVFQMAHVVEGTEQPVPDSEGIIHNEWAIHQIRTTSSFARGNIFLNWYVGGLNFQIEHHLFSAICHLHYPKISPIIEQTAKDFGLVYNIKPSFAQAFISHRKRLKELGRN